MSYTIFICRCLPSDDPEDYWNLLDVDTDEAPSQGMIALVRSFLTFYPDITELSDDQLEEGVWADGPIVNNIVGDTVKLSLSTDDVLPHIVELSNVKGYCVFDLQDDVIYEPLVL